MKIDDCAGSWGGVGNNFPYILLNEIQTVFSQLPKRSAKVLLADLRIDHVHYIKTIDQRVTEGTKTWQSKAGLFLTIMFCNSQIY